MSVHSNSALGKFSSSPFFKGISVPCCCYFYFLSCRKPFPYVCAINKALEAFTEKFKDTLKRAGK